MVRKDKIGPLMPTIREELGSKRVIMLDVMGPFPETKRGNKSIIISLTLQDMWPSAEAVKSVTQEAVIAHLKRRAEDEGSMDEIWSDRGSVIIGSMAKAFYDEDAGS